MAGLTVSGLALAAAISPALAQESISLGNGGYLNVLDYVIETDGEGVRTLFVKGEPDFVPEPFGPVPSDEYARTYEPLCQTLIDNSWDSLESEEIDFVVVRADFEPTVNESEFIVTRFHEALFEVTEEPGCRPIPLGVGRYNGAPDLPSGVNATARYIETGPVPRRLTMTYTLDTPIAEIERDILENAAIELCILHADLVLESQSQYYEQIETETVAITFAEGPTERGIERTETFLFGVRDYACESGLSPMISDAIRGRTADENSAEQ
ncbi:hypothetical protein [Pelagibacterium montanilacus]|uniref:hypothetical protein n=1 Tax=Pelagibacterium montanilacus TaxID=2185280 RepID=UPI0019D31F46|nr:hypothetical protein [Pelagibacterium montanilacus]